MRSVLITGISSGIGLATVVVLASRGWRVFATMRNLKKRGLLDQSLRTAGAQDKSYVEELDVTSQASIQAATNSILARTGNTLDAVVHNAGAAAAGALAAVIIFWPAAFLVSGDDAQTAELARLKGEFTAIQPISIPKKCVRLHSRSPRSHRPVTFR